MNFKFALFALTLMNALYAENLSVFDRYTTLRTIAGTGTDREQNFWQSSFEGADPRAVELSNPHDCGSDAFGRVFIVDKQSHSVLMVSADGSTLTTVLGTHQSANGGDEPQVATSVAIQNPNGLHVFADGSFLVLDTDNRKVRIVDTAGICRTLFTHSPGFSGGRGLVATADGSAVYFNGEFTAVGMQTVKRWTETGGIETFATIPVPDGTLGNLDLAPDGALFVTANRGHLVYRVVEGGVPEIVAGNGFADGNTTSGSLATQVSLNRVRGVAVLPDGTFFLATQKGGDIWWVDNDPAGRRIHLFLAGDSSGNTFSGDGLPRSTTFSRIAEPRAITLATNGDLLITCNDNGFIRAIRNVCKPIAPEPRVENGNLTWSTGWKEVVVVEESNTLKPNSWSLAEVTSGMQSIPLVSYGEKSFFRLSVPNLAGGQ